MTVATYEVEKQFLTYVKKIQNYGEALSLMFWDLRTGAPKKGVDQRSEVIGMLSSEVFAMSTSDEMGNYLTELENLIREDKLSETTKKMVEECRKEYDRNKKIPQAEYEAYVKLEAKAESVWEEARENLISKCSVRI